MASNERKRKSDSLATEPREGLRKVAKVTGSGLVTCPVCELTLWPGKVEEHYQQELTKLMGPSPSLAHSKRKRTSTSSAAKDSSARDKLFKRVEKVLESVKRRQILFTQQPGPTSSTHLSLEQPSCSHSTPSCPVCDCPLPADEGEAEAHVEACLSQEGGGGGEESSDSETYEEYTWCDETRIRATSMLTPQARANMFDGGAVISKVDTSIDDEVDVEDDETTLYGSPQYDESDVERCLEGPEASGREEKSDGGKKNCEKTSNSRSQKQHCLICMDQYHDPVVSVKCWHVYCERCWLQALANKKLCPKCKEITSTCHLRKIFL